MVRSLMLHFGVPLDTHPSHPTYFVGEGRLVFDHIDDIATTISSGQAYACASRPAGRGAGATRMVAPGGRRRPRRKDTPMKNLSWIIVPLALLTLAPATVSAGQAVEKTKDAVVKDAKIVGTKTKEGLSKTGEVMTDAWITTRIHERFVGEDLLKGSDISVDTAQHVVTLKGTVVGSKGRARAARVAKDTEGVHRVINHLTIGPKR